MAPPPAGRPIVLLLFLLPVLAASDPVLDDGYAVTTFSDLNPLPASGPHPYAVLPRPRAGDLLLLDSAGAALYTLALPTPGEPRGLAAAFDRPRSVAVDAADNVYVADRARVAGHLHGVVRKVAPDGEWPSPPALLRASFGSLVSEPRFRVRWMWCGECLVGGRGLL
jgi:hypothetical protein